MATVRSQRTRLRHREAVEQDSGLHRHLGRTGLLFAAVGSIIGSGWLFGALNSSSRSASAWERR